MLCGHLRPSALSGRLRSAPRTSRRWPRLVVLPASEPLSASYNTVETISSSHLSIDAGRPERIADTLEAPSAAELESLRKQFLSLYQEDLRETAHRYLTWDLKAHNGGGVATWNSIKKKLNDFNSSVKQAPASAAEVAHWLPLLCTEADRFVREVKSAFAGTLRSSGRGRNSWFARNAKSYGMRSFGRTLQDLCDWVTQATSTLSRLKFIVRVSREHPGTSDSYKRLYPPHQACSVSGGCVGANGTDNGSPSFTPNAICLTYKTVRVQ